MEDWMEVCALDEEFERVIDEDEKDEFISLISRKIRCFRYLPQKVLKEVLSPFSIRCAEALVTGQTSINADLNLPCGDDGTYPLHLVASDGCTPSLIEFLLCYGARTDVRLSSYQNMLPLQIALQTTRYFLLFTLKLNHFICVIFIPFLPFFQ